MDKSKAELGQAFVEALNSVGIENIQDIPEGCNHSVMNNLTINNIPFTVPSKKSLEERQREFVDVLNGYGITDIKDIPEGYYTPLIEYKEVWIVK